jgi:hypothetical protein
MWPSCRFGVFVDGLAQPQPKNPIGQIPGQWPVRGYLRRPPTAAYAFAASYSFFSSSIRVRVYSGSLVVVFRRPHRAAQIPSNAAGDSGSTWPPSTTRVWPVM